jgi:hypothetical protein
LKELGMGAQEMFFRGYELRFHSLFNPGRGYVFPCDSAGHVAIDSLSEHARNNYLYARAVIGREFHAPVVQQVSSEGR